MIECCSEKIWRKNKPVKKIFIVFLVIFLIITTLFSYYHLVVKKVIINYCDKYLFSVNASVINNSVSTSLNNYTTYSDLINVEKDVNGNIVLINTNSYKVNNLSRQVEKLTFDLMKNKIKNGVQIPILAFLGLDFLSGYGKNINLKILEITTVLCKFESKFVSVGINQTLHSIYINVETENSIFLPFNEKKNKCQSKILICESILVGKVPDIYLNGKLFN